MGCVDLVIFYPGGRGLTRTRCLFPVSSPVLLYSVSFFHRNCQRSHHTVEPDRTVDGLVLKTRPGALLIVW